LATDVAFKVLYGFNECNFLGGLEATATPFLPACVSVGNAANALIQDCYFDFEGTPAVVGGRIAIETESTLGALTNPGYLTVAGCTFNKMGANADDVNIRGAIYVQDIAKLQVTDNRFLDSTSAAIVWGAEVDTVEVAGNMVDGLVGTNVLGGIVSVVTTRTTPGDNWLIDSNELIDVAANAIVIDGASGGVDVSFVSILNNVIDSPTAAAVLVENVDGLTIGKNQINMASLDAVNAIQIDTDGVTGLIKIQGNSLVNVGSATGTAILSDVTCTGAIFDVDGNSIENGIDGITITGAATTALITNNAMHEVTGDLLTVQNLTNCTIDGNSYTGTAPTKYADNDGTITNLVVGENLWPQADDSITSVASASALPITAHYHLLTGTTAVNTLAMGADVKGWIVTIQGPAASSVTFNNGASLNLGSATRVLSATDTLTLGNAGSNVWNEVAFSNN